MSCKVIFKLFPSLILSVVLLSGSASKVMGQGVTDHPVLNDVDVEMNEDGTVSDIHIPKTVVEEPTDKEKAESSLYDWVKIDDVVVTNAAKVESDIEKALEGYEGTPDFVQDHIRTVMSGDVKVSDLSVNSTGYITVNGQDVGGYVGIKYKYDSKGVVVGTQKIFIPYDTNQVNPANLPDGWDDHIGEGPPPRPPCPSKVTPTSNQIISYDSTAPIPFSWIYGGWGGVLGVAGGSSVDQSGGGDGLPVSAYVRV